MKFALKRREFISLLGGAAAAWPIAARAQQPAMPVVVVLNAGSVDQSTERLSAFGKGLARAGYIEGQNLAIELRYARNGLQQVPELAAELVRMKVDVITTFGDLTPKIAAEATSTIPIVAICDDIVGAGLVASLSRPERNMTGLTIMSPELSAKRLELLREIVPGISRVAALWDPTTGASQVVATERAAKSMDLSLQVLEIQQREDVVRSFRAARDERANAINVFSSPFLASLFREIIVLSAEYRLPAIYQWKEHVEAGGLVSFGPSLAAMFRQTATIVVKILKGARPSDIPVEQPIKFELAVNARTAHALGLAIPSPLLVRADEVIE
jgi:putative ABC transport system substrate-binding protein